MIYNAPLTVKFADELLIEGVYAIGFCFHGGAKRKDWIMLQLSAAHTT